MIQNISILGCGWLGRPLALHLLQKGYRVKGSTTTPAKIPLLQQQGIKAFELALTPQWQGDTQLLDSELLIVDIPPGSKHGADFHPAQIRALIEQLHNSPVQKIIFISSTSVYADLNREVFEPDALPDHPIVQAETLLREQSQWQTTVLRCGGLLGYDRIPGRYFAGKKGLTTGALPVNFIHRDDVIGIVEAVIARQCWGEVLNVVAPQHPTRREVYLRNAAQFGFEAPEFAPQASEPFKIVSCQKLEQLLGYAFLYPDPLEFSFG